MANDKNTTKFKLLFMFNFFVLDYYQEVIVVHDKHRGFCDLQNPLIGYIDV